MDNSRDLVLARLYLKAVLPLLEDIAAFDTALQELIKEWDFKLQFQLPGGDPATALIFKRGAVTAVRNDIKGPRVSLTFKDANFLNAVFQNTTAKSPRPNLAGLFHYKKLLLLNTVLGRLEYYLKPTAPMLEDPALLGICVRLTLYSLAFGLKEIGEHDPEAAPISAHLPDGVVEIKVSGGPAAHISVCGGKFQPGKDAAVKASAILEINDLPTAWSMLRGELDLFSAVGSGNIRLRGYIPLLDGINPLMDRLAMYLAT